MMRSFLQQLMRDESGQDLVEYALLGSLIAVVSAAALTTLGPAITGFYTRLGDMMSSL